MVIVTFPDGSRVRAASLADRRPDDPERAYGLYLDERWAPTWPAISSPGRTSACPPTPTSRRSRSAMPFSEPAVASSWKSAAWAGAAGLARSWRAWPFSQASRRRRPFRGFARHIGRRPWRQPNRKRGFSGLPAGRLKRGRRRSAAAADAEANRRCPGANAEDERDAAASRAQVEAAGIGAALAGAAGAAREPQRARGLACIPPDDRGTASPRSRDGDGHSRRAGPDDQPRLAPVRPRATDVDDLAEEGGRHRERIEHRPVTVGAVGKPRVVDGLVAGNGPDPRAASVGRRRPSGREGDGNDCNHGCSPHFRTIRRGSRRGSILQA